MPIHTQLLLGELPPLELTLRDEAWLGTAMEQPPATVPTVDVAAAATAALQSPVGFPPIADGMLPDDHVAIAVGEGVRQADDVVRGIVAALDQVGVDRSTINIVCGTVIEAELLRQQLEDLVSTGCVVVGHLASDDDALCFLAAVEDEPLMMNRQLFEADMVIPVGCGRAASSRDSRGPFECVFPRFSDMLTQQRYAQADALDSPAAMAIRRRETDQAGWLLGSALVMQVVPALGGGVARVVAGAPDEVARVVAEACDHEWTTSIEQPARLVVATLAGGAAEQTWDNVARALHAAAQAADADDSAVAICTQLDTPPGEALAKLIATDGDLERAAKLHSIQSDDAAAAWEIYKARCRGPVYFMSQLKQDVVEELGMTPVANAQELTRLVERSENCVLLNEVQHAVPKLAESNLVDPNTIN